MNAAKLKSEAEQLRQETEALNRTAGPILAMAELLSAYRSKLTKASQLLTFAAGSIPDENSDRNAETVSTPAQEDARSNQRRT